MDSKKQERKWLTELHTPQTDHQDNVKRKQVDSVPTGQLSYYKITRKKMAMRSCHYFTQKFPASPTGTCLKLI